jgi:hypothetical protein
LSGQNEARRTAKSEIAGASLQPLNQTDKKPDPTQKAASGAEADEVTERQSIPEVAAARSEAEAAKRESETFKRLAAAAKVEAELAKREAEEAKANTLQSLFMQTLDRAKHNATLLLGLVLLLGAWAGIAIGNRRPKREQPKAYEKLSVPVPLHDPSSRPVDTEEAEAEDATNSRYASRAARLAHSLTAEETTFSPETGKKPKYATAECFDCHIRLPKPEMHKSSISRFTPSSGRAYYKRTKGGYFYQSGYSVGSGGRTSTKEVWRCADCHAKYKAYQFSALGVLGSVGRLVLGVLLGILKALSNPR